MTTLDSFVLSYVPRFDSASSFMAAVTRILLTVLFVVIVKHISARANVQRLSARLSVACSRKLLSRDKKHEEHRDALALTLALLTASARNSHIHSHRGEQVKGEGEGEEGEREGEFEREAHKQEEEEEGDFDEESVLCLTAYDIARIANDDLTKRNNERKTKEKEKEQEQENNINETKNSHVSNDTSSSSSASSSAAASSFSPRPQTNSGVSVLNVVAVYCSRSLRECDSDKVNGVGVVTEEVYQEACNTAKFKDQEQEILETATPEILRGVPLSVKDQFIQRGCDSTNGLAARVFQLHDYDGLLVSLLRDAGAIPYVRTNVPQAILNAETKNQIWGRSTHSRDLKRASPADAVLLAKRASLLGIGTDIDGSIRISAHINGVCGFKPTGGRISNLGISSPYAGYQNIILTTPGPLARNVSDLSLVIRAWLVDRMWNADLSIPRLPFRLSAYDSIASGQRKLRIGYYFTNGFFKPASACVRAVQEVVDALTKEGHTLIPFEPPGFLDAIRLYQAAMTSDCGKYLFDSVEGEELDQIHSSFSRFCSLPWFVRSLFVEYLRSVGEHRAALLLSHTCLRTSSSSSSNSSFFFEHVHLPIIKFRTSFWEAYSSSDYSLDAVISPPSATPALLHNDLLMSALPSSSFLSSLLPPLSSVCNSYSILYNVLNCPACVIPVTHVRPSEAVYDEDDDERGHKHVVDSFSRRARLSMRDSAGLAVGVQVATAPNHDEECLAVSRVIEICIKTHFTDE